MKTIPFMKNIDLMWCIQHLFQHTYSLDRNPRPFHFLLHSLSITQWT
uniref:Uncharacterized protein n=1 Tax=Arundo donax TaxID=35708 RepID=A0A0A9D5P1_ARUDO